MKKKINKKVNELYENIKINSDKWLSLENLLNEEWKDIKDSNGKYQISNYGRIKSFNNNKIIIMRTNKSNVGYYLVRISIKNKLKTYTVHKLVALHFIHNPNLYPCINHIDGNKENNRVDNLEWCTHSYNNKEAYRLNLAHSPNLGKTGSKHPGATKVNQYDLNGNYIKTWGTMKEAAESLNVSINSISSCCRYKIKTAKNYIWRYADKKLKYTKKEIEKANKIMTFIYKLKDWDNREAFERHCRVREIKHIDQCTPEAFDKYCKEKEIRL